MATLIESGTEKTVKPIIIHCKHCRSSILVYKSELDSRPPVECPACRNKLFASRFERFLGKIRYALHPLNDER